jgi:hypothetical protein
MQLCSEITISDEPTLPENPEMIVFAAYQGVPKSPAKITMLNALVRGASELHASISIYLSHNSSLELFNCLQ